MGFQGTRAAFWFRSPECLSQISELLMLEPCAAPWVCTKLCHSPASRPEPGRHCGLCGAVWSRVGLYGAVRSSVGLCALQQCPTLLLYKKTL